MSPSPVSPDRPADWEAFYRDYRQAGYVPGFEITTKLGGGMFGLVFRARRLSIGKDYAIKFLQVDDMDVRRAVLAELEQVKYFAQIDHPNLVSIEDRGEVDGIPYLIMAFAGTETLRDRMVADVVPVGEAKDELLRCFLQCCRGLAALHERSLVHFDIKPANVFLKGAVARLGDYGLSKLVTHSRGSLSMGRGTPYYMAPEMLQRRGDHRSDIYSLGVMLYELLCGKVPFTGDSEWEVLRKHETAAPTLPGHLSAIERAVLQRCLQKDPAARFQSVHDLIAAFGAPAGVGAAAWTDVRSDTGSSGATGSTGGAPPPPAAAVPPTPGHDPYQEFGKASREALKHANTIAQRAAKQARLVAGKAAQKASQIMRETMQRTRSRHVRRFGAWRRLQRMHRSARARERLVAVADAVANPRRRGSIVRLAFVFLLVTVGVLGVGALFFMVAPVPAPMAVAAASPTVDIDRVPIYSTISVPSEFRQLVSTAEPRWVRLARQDRTRARQELLAHIDRLRAGAPLSPAQRREIAELPQFEVASYYQERLQRATVESSVLQRGSSYPTASAARLLAQGAVMLAAVADQLATHPFRNAADVERARRLHRWLSEATGCDDILWLEGDDSSPAAAFAANRDLGRLWIWFTNEFASSERVWSTFRALMNNR